MVSYKVHYILILFFFNKDPVSFPHSRNIIIMLLFFCLKVGISGCICQPFELFSFKVKCSIPFFNMAALANANLVQNYDLSWIGVVQGKKEQISIPLLTPECLFMTIAWKFRFRTAWFSVPSGITFLTFGFSTVQTWHSESGGMLRFLAINVHFAKSRKCLYAEHAFPFLEEQ